MRATSFSFKAALLVAACALSGCGSREATPATKLFGEVTLRDAASLPPGARLEVRLEDAGKAGSAGSSTGGLSPSPAASIATQTVDAGGQKPPIPFTLPVPRDALLPRHEYILRAEIRSATGDVLFKGLPDQPPIGNPNTTGRIELAVIPASK